MTAGARKGILPLVIITIAVFITVFMMKYRVTPKKVEVTENIVPVNVIPVTYETTRIRIPAQGTVRSAVQISLRPEVNGRVTRISRNLVPGGTFQAGELMFQIDTRNYQMFAANQEHSLAAAELALKQEQARSRVAEREWDLLDGTVDNTAADKELALRIPQLRQAKAAVKAAQKSLEKARLDVERCTIQAPFNGIVIRESVDPGQVVSMNSETAVLSGTDEYWVQLSVPVENLRFIRFPTEEIPGSAVAITQSTGNGTITREGRVVRLLGDMTEAGRMARMLVSVPDPTKPADDLDLPLLIGSFVNVEILGRELNNVVRIPRSALHTLENGKIGETQRMDAVWIMNEEDRLEIREVTVSWRTVDDVYIHNSLQPGERLIVSSIATPIEGMKLSKIEMETGKGGGLLK